MLSGFTAGPAKIEKFGCDFIAGTAKTRKSCRDFIAGTAKIEKFGCDFIAGTAKIRKSCRDFIAGTAKAKTNCTYVTCKTNLKAWYGNNIICLP